ncbi:MFS transporter [Labedella gwakjiensis]|uniref:MFS transporter n=1 Tax=Labedella gwakjiensis TaxID=390269 RepID=A0ABY0CE86_9MICO|nr:MFS transporter [Labedella gwakjiensis]
MVEPSPERSTFAPVAASYALQGLGYAVVVTALPSFQSRHALDATMVAVILLGVCVAASLGSILADLVAVRAGSRSAVRVGFLLQVAGLAVAALSPSVVLFIAAIAVYGIGLGAIDASSNMQGVLVERRIDRPALGRFFAAYTVGAIVGAVAMSLALALTLGAVAALLVAAALQVVLVLVVVPRLDGTRAARPPRDERSAPTAALPRAPIVALGLVVLAAFTVDAGVSTWSSVHLTALGVGAAVAPLGYALYQAAVLASRLGTDPLTRRIGRSGTAVAGVAVGVLGGLVVALVPGSAAALVGFALSGLAVGVLVPVAFGAAGDVLPARSDEVIARVNLFNYGGALLGAVGIGALIDGVGGLAFLIPAVILLAAVAGVRVMRRQPVPVA